MWLLFVLAALSGERVALGTAAALAIVLGLLALRQWARTAGIRGAARFGNRDNVGGGRGVVAGLCRRRERERRDGRPLAPFDPSAIPQLVGEGKTVFVDVTAAWCLTCKVNEAAVLDRDPVASRLFGPDVVAMRGDWTRPDPALTRYLQDFGRYGIPFNAVYGPGRPNGELLPELLTSGTVENALDRAASRGVALR